MTSIIVIGTIILSSILVSLLGRLIERRSDRREDREDQKRPPSQRISVIRRALRQVRRPSDVPSGRAYTLGWIGMPDSDPESTVQRPGSLAARITP